MARLDRLGAAKGVAQLGATIGRQFAYELLQAVSPLNEATLQHELGRLVEAELLYQRRASLQATYTFKHALIQDAAYQSLLRSTRQQYHQRIAQVLEAQFPDVVETQPELLAHHYAESELTEQALVYWRCAGERAVQRLASLEAYSHLTKGLELLRTLPDIQGRAQQEIVLQTTLGPVLMVTKGYASSEVEHTYAWAHEICKRLENTPQVFPVICGLWGFYMVCAELQTAREMMEHFLRLAELRRALDTADLQEAQTLLAGDGVTAPGKGAGSPRRGGSVGVRKSHCLQGGRHVTL